MYSIEIATLQFPPQVTLYFSNHAISNFMLLNKISFAILGIQTREFEAKDVIIHSRHTARTCYVG